MGLGCRERRGGPVYVRGKLEASVPMVSYQSYQLIFLGGLFALCVLFLAVAHTVSFVVERAQARKQQRAAPTRGPARKAA